MTTRFDPRAFVEESPTGVADLSILTYEPVETMLETANGAPLALAAMQFADPDDHNRRWYFGAGTLTPIPSKLTIQCIDAFAQTPAEAGDPYCTLCLKLFDAAGNALTSALAFWQCGLVRTFDGLEGAYLGNLLIPLSFTPLNPAWDGFANAIQLSWVRNYRPDDGGTFRIYLPKYMRFIC